MSLLKEIRRQSPGVRTAFWALSVFVTLSIVGSFWLSSAERQLFFAFERNEQEQEAFLARQEDRGPDVFASIGRGVSSITASIGSLLGFDRASGLPTEQAEPSFDTGPQEDTVYLLPLSK